MSATSPQTASDRNLLFGILALQMDFIARDALIAAMNAWVLDKDKPLGRILREQGALGEDEHILLEALVNKHLEKHGNDSARSLAAVSSVNSLRQVLEQIADNEVQASLTHLPARGDEAPATRPPLIQAALAPGQRFRVLRPHARGGLGQVSVALDAELHREVALKEIQEDQADDAVNRQRFMVEAEITGGLEHPGIVPVYSLGVYADGRPFYAMRFIRGDSLHDAMRRFHLPRAKKTDLGERALELRKLLGRFLDVCNAIAYAHSRGVLHRDLKPGNIMLGDYGETLVVDWGLAKVLGRPVLGDASAEQVLQPPSASGSAPTQMGSAVGTPHFMSPEQAAGRLDLLGPASDVYSLGATLYALLTGQAPFQAKDVEEVLRDVQKGDFPPPRRLNRDVSPALEAICLKAMALKPEARYPSPRALADDLEHWLADEPTTAYRESSRQRFARWARRHRTTVAAASVGLILTVAAGVGGLWLWSAAEQKREASERQHRTSLQAEAEADQRLALIQLQAGQFESAEGILARAIQRLEDEPELASLLPALEVRRAQARNLLTFYEQSDRAHVQVMLQRDREAQTAVEKALGAVSAFEREQWWTHLPDQDLTMDQKQRLREDVFRQLLMLAAIRGKPGMMQFGAKESAPAYRATLEVLARAQRYRRTFVAGLAEMICHLGLGELAKVRLPDPPQPKADDAVDHLFIGMLHSWLGVRPSDAFSGLLLQQVRFLGLKGLDLKEPLKAAERHLRTAIRLDPQHYWSHLILAGTLMTRDPESAELSFNACLALQPRNVAVFLARADIRISQAELSTDGKRRRQLLQQALADLDEAVRRNRDNFLVYVNRSECRIHLGDLAAALADADTALRLDPGNSVALFKRARVHLERKNFDLALADATAALHSEPGNPETLDVQGLSRAGKGDHAGAIRDLDEAIRLNPWVSAFFVHRAQSHFALNANDQALKDCDSAIRLQPDNAVLYNYRGQIWYRKGEYRKAVAEYDEAIRRFSTAADWYANRADAYWRLGDFDKVLLDCDAALKINSSQAMAWNLRGLVRSRRGDFAGAFAAHDLAISLTPDRTYYYSNRGWCHLRLGRPEQALADFDKALSLSARNEDAHNFRGLLHAERGDHQKAVADYSEAIHIAPRAAGFLDNRAQSFVRLKQLDKALADLNQALALEPMVSAFHIRRGEIHAQRVAWEPAERNLARACELAPAEAFARYALDLVKLRRGDRAGYEKNLLILLEETEKTWTEHGYTWLIRAGFLSAPPAEVSRRLLALAEKRLADLPQRQGAIMSVGIFLFRTGQVEEAAKRLEASLVGAMDGFDPLRWLYLALVSERQKKTDTAKLWLRMATDFMDDRPGKPTQPRAFRDLSWFERLELEILRHEVEDKLGPAR